MLNVTTARTSMIVCQRDTAIGSCVTWTRPQTAAGVEKKDTFETHMKESGSHKCAFTCRVCGEGLNGSKVHFQSTCLYNETSGQAYQSQAYHRNISCLTHWDLQNHCASLRGDAKLAWANDVMHGLWEKQKPQAWTQTKTKSSSIDAEYIGVQEERRHYV